MLADADDHLKGVLYLDLKVHHVLFNQKGKYNLKFSISGSRGDLRNVKLYLNGAKQSMFEYEYTSDPCYQDDVDNPCQLDNNQFKFEMPEEFSEGEVLLLFETYKFTDNPLEDPFKCGQGKFLVFPCASPIPNDQPSTSTERYICYNYTTQIALNNLLSEEQVYVNIGHVQITVLLKIDHNQRNQTRYASSSNLPCEPLHKTIISEEPSEDCTQNDDIESLYSFPRNFEKSSLDSETVCTSQLNSLHVNPGSIRDDLSEETEDISGNVSSEVVSTSLQGFQSRQNLQRHSQDREESKGFRSRRVFDKDLQMSGEASVDIRRDSYSENRKDSIPHKDKSSSKEYLQNRKNTVRNIEQHSLQKKLGNEQDRVGQKTKNRNTFDKEKITDEENRKISQQTAIPRNMSLSSKKMTQVNDAALPTSAEGPPTRHLCGSHLNEVGIYEVVIQVHSACDLPSNTQGRPPQPYVTCNATNNVECSTATHATLHSTNSPLWDELLVMKVPKKNFSNLELILNIIDHPRKTLITGYRLPVEPLKPFYPYHLELEHAGSENKAKLFISLMLKTDELIQSSLQSDVFGLEVVLRHFTSNTIESCFTDPLVVAMRIVSDVDQYRQRCADVKHRESYIRIRKLKVPSKDVIGTLKSMYDENQYNAPQVTFAGVEQWNQMFFFYGDDRWLFTPSSALVIEYFNASQVVSFGRWQPRSPIGYSVLDLDDILLNILKQENATMGIRVDNIAVNKSSLRDKSGGLVNVILRLITNSRPDAMISSTHFNILPSIDASIKQHSLSLQRNMVQNKNSSSIPLPMINELSTSASDVNGTLGQPKAAADPDATAFSVMEHQAKELEKHRYAMKKMADDILKLKSEATRLQATNSRLQLQLDRETNLPVSLPLQLENTTHAELVQRIVIIKGSLDEQIAIKRELKLEIQSLQNQLIKKNEKEKGLYKLQEAHKNQQMLLQKMQEKLRRTKTLEETCKRQEKVIIRLEEFLANSKGKEKRKKDEDEQEKTTEENLLEETKRLRALVLNYERTNKAVEDMDRLEMHEKLRRAEGRVDALEKELLENTRRWARDKADLQLKLSETQVSQQSGQWQYTNLSQEPLSLFDRTPPTSVNIHNHSRLTSPKLSPLTKK